MKNCKILKNFVVFEGLDGSGTTTQLNLLSIRLQEKNIPFWITSEPSDMEIGYLIRKILQKEKIVEPKTLAFLFAADRHEHIYNNDRGIVGRLEHEQLVLTDRYLFSSLAYQSDECGFDFVYTLNREFPLPEHLFFLDVSPEMCQQRLTSRGGTELFDALSQQRRILEWYRYVLTFFNSTNMNIHVVNGEENTDTVFEKVWSIMQHFPITKI